MSSQLEQLQQQVQAILGADNVLRPLAEHRHYGIDRSRCAAAPNPSLIVFPTSVLQLQELVRFANQHALALVPSGGRTGLSGGAVAADGEIVVAMDKLNKVLEVNVVDRLLRCQAGVITAQVHALAAEQGLMFPVDFAASGSSQIGGNIATNAGGVRVIRYGMMRNWVAGLTVVCGDGKLLELNRGLQKNNAGFDLRQLFIGSEGCLGFIVEAQLRLTRAQSRVSVMLLAFENMPDILSFLESIQSQLNLTAFEFFSHNALQKVLDKTAMQPPLAARADFYALVECETDSEIDSELHVLLEQSMASGLLVDGVLSQSEGQSRQLWAMRENISDALSEFRPYKNDLCVRVSRLPDLLLAIESLILTRYRGLEVVWFGHIGDGNVHLNLLPAEGISDEKFVATCQAIDADVADIIDRFGGSISAEHGIGLLKRDTFERHCDADQLQVMRAIKATLDPNAIMNPGKLLSK